jgi:parallel beta-helix repeat protein
MKSHTYSTGKLLLRTVAAGVFFVLFANNSHANSVWYNGQFYVWDIDQTTYMGSDWTGVVRIMADDINFYMDGHQICGPGTNIGLVISGRDNVNIYGGDEYDAYADTGVIYNCNTGVYCENSSNIEIESISFDCISWGVRADYSEFVTTKACMGTTNYDGILCYYTDRFSCFSNNFYNCSRSGLWSTGSYYSLVYSNTFNANDADGITLYDVDNCELINNHTDWNGYGGQNRNGTSYFISTAISTRNCYSNYNSNWGYYQEGTPNIGYALLAGVGNGSGLKNF